MSKPAADSFLDRPLARVLAALVVCGVVAVLALQHWDDLFPPPPEAALADPDDPVAQCIARERAAIEQMIEATPEMAAQQELFLQRAEARCQATVGGGNAGTPRGPLE